MNDRETNDDYQKLGFRPGEFDLCLNEWYYNQIVVALIDDEATLKRFRPQLDGTIRLHPENDRLEDIIVDASHCVIQGVAVKILKDAR